MRRPPGGVRYAPRAPRRVPQRPADRAGREPAAILRAAAPASLHLRGAASRRRPVLLRWRHLADTLPRLLLQPPGWRGPRAGRAPAGAARSIRAGRCDTEPRTAGRRAPVPELRFP